MGGINHQKWLVYYCDTHIIVDFRDNWKINMKLSAKKMISLQIEVTASGEESRPNKKYRLHCV